MAVAGLAAAKAGSIVAPTADKFLGAISRAATTDIAVLKSRVFRPHVRSGKGSKKSRTRDEPIDVELHINPIGVAIGAIGLGVAYIVMAGTVKTGGVWARKEVTVYEGPFASFGALGVQSTTESRQRFNRYREARTIRQAGGTPGMPQPLAAGNEIARFELGLTEGDGWARRRVVRFRQQKPMLERMRDG